MEIFLNNPYLFAAAALAVINSLSLVILAWQFRVYKKRQRDLLRGETVANLEELVLKHKQTLLSHNKNLKELGKILEELVDDSKLNIQKIGLVRFNPFAREGGNMSFAMALLDGKQNGIVISSLHSREGTRIYAKDIAAGESKYHLTDEEKAAISNAKS